MDRKQVNGGIGARLARPDLRLILFFIALSFLCLGAHELIHHLTARAVCGAWGTMTLSFFFLAPGWSSRRGGSRRSPGRCSPTP